MTDTHTAAPASPRPPRGEDEDPYARGVEAHDTNVSDTANPYDIDEQWDDHCAWNDGWSAAAEAATDDAMESGQ